MNPFNLLINYVIANSRATFYNVPGNQEITNTALLTGMVSENPLMSYLIIENKAKIEGEKFNTPVVPAASGGTTTTPGLPASGTSPAGTDTPTNTTEPPKGTETGGTETGGTETGGTETGGTETGGTACAGTVTLEAVKNEISVSNQILKDEIAKSLESNKAELNKLIAEKLEAKIAFLEKSTITINESIIEIKKRLGEISNANQAADTSVGTKGISNQKGSAKSDTK